MYTYGFWIPKTRTDDGGAGTDYNSRDHKFMSGV